MSNRNCKKLLGTASYHNHPESSIIPRVDAQMEINTPVNRAFRVNLGPRSVVRATNPPTEPHIVILSNLDLLSGRFPVTYFYFYCRPRADTFSSIIESIKSSLATTLNYFYPFAGRIVQNPTTNEPEIICDNSGALVLEAHSNIALKELDFYDFDQFMQGKLVNIIPDFAVQVQVTQYACGGISITFTFDHALGDASAFGKFLVSWSEVAKNQPISCKPDHRRNLQARSPPCYHPSLDHTFIKCTLEEIANIPTKNILLKRLYHIDGANINHLQRIASIEGQRRTKIEAFSAYIWKIMVKTIDKSHTKSKMGWLVDGRPRMDLNPDKMSDYIGNILSLAFAEASIAELKSGSITGIAEVVHNAICKVTNKTHFLDLIDWIECQRPGLMMSRIVLGQGGPALILSSGRRFPVAEVDFGFGSPILGTVCSIIEKIGVGYMNQRPSARGDGSWTISAILWPELAAALESDSIFHPMSTTYLKL